MGDDHVSFSKIHNTCNMKKRLEEVNVKTGASLVAQMAKNLTAIRRPGFDLWVWKIPLQKGMANHSSILAWRIPWTEEPGRLQSMGSQGVRHN